MFEVEWKINLENFTFFKIEMKYHRVKSDFCTCASFLMTLASILEAVSAFVESSNDFKLNFHPYLQEFFSKDF